MGPGSTPVEAVRWRCDSEPLPGIRGFLIRGHTAYMQEQEGEGAALPAALLAARSAADLELVVPNALVNCWSSGATRGS